MLKHYFLILENKKILELLKLPAVAPVILLREKVEKLFHIKSATLCFVLAVICCVGVIKGCDKSHRCACVSTSPPFIGRYYTVPYIWCIQYTIRSGPSFHIRVNDVCTVCLGSTNNFFLFSFFMSDLACY